MRSEKQNSFVKNTVILSFAGIFSRVLGAFFRIPLYRLIADEGMGLYTTGYNIYAMLLAISTTGIPIAISKLVAEEVSGNRLGEARRIFRFAAIMLTVIGFFVTLGLIFTAPFIADIIGDSRAVYPLITIAPAIFIVALMAAFRGFFQGLQRMWPTAISQIFEQIGRVITGLLLVWYMVRNSSPVEYTAAAACSGATVGSLIGLIVILVIYFKSKPYLNKLTSNSEPAKINKKIIKKILLFAIPITIGAMVIPFMNGIDVALVPRRLQSIGYTESQSMALYGRLTAVVPLINLPSLLAYALAASLVPAVSMATAKGRSNAVRSRSRLAVKLVLLIGLPAAAGLSLLAEPVCLLLYNDILLAPILEILAFVAVFLTLHQACTGILQGLGQTSIPVRNLFIGGMAKVILNFILPAIPALNIRGAAISSVVAYGIASILNIRAVCRHAGLRIKWFNMITKPLIATAVMSVFVGLGYNTLMGFGVNNILATLTVIAGGMIIFLASILLTRFFSRSELNAIPVIGSSLIKIVSALGILRSE